MEISTKPNLKITLVLFICFLMLSLSASSANRLPCTKDVNSLGQKCRLTVDTFMHQSQRLRLGYEFSGKFVNNSDRQELYELANTAGEALLTIASQQQKLKNQIEDYQGDDWDGRYGQTGLWRKLSKELAITKLNKCEIDYYLAVSSLPQQREKTLQAILKQI